MQPFLENYFIMKRKRRNEEDPVACDNSVVRNKIWLFKH